MGIRNGQIPVNEKARPHSGVWTFCSLRQVRGNGENLHNVLFFTVFLNSSLQCQKVHFTGLFKAAEIINLTHATRVRD